MAEAKPAVFEVDFASFCATGSKNVPRQAEALLEWWKSFQQTGFQRKNPGCSIILSCNGVLRITGVEDTANAEHKIRSSMKKIKAEDLGNMQATDLLASIPEEDPQGRGLRDMREMEKKLSVKVYFDTSSGGGHVFLVGDAKKLEKKVFVMRNVLNHYHWRLSGLDPSRLCK